MRHWLPLLMLAGCSSQGSLEVRVSAPPEMPVKEVQLYVGLHQETGAIRPAEGPLESSVFWRRDENALDVLPMNDDGVVVFPFLQGGTENSIAAVIAVGFGADDQPVGVASHLVWMDIPGDEIHRYELELAPFDPLPRDNTMPTTRPGLQVWGPPNEPRLCVQVDNVRELQMAEYAGASSAMIVRRDDIDCDGYVKTSDPQTNLECLENEYMAQDAMTRDNLQCLGREVVVGGAATYEACILGGSTCADGVGSSGACSPTAYCAPSGMCSCLATGGGCSPYDYELARTAYVKCVVASADGQYCENVRPVIDLYALNPGYDVNALTCDENLGALLRVDANQSWDKAVPVPGTVDGKLVISDLRECAWEVRAAHTALDSVGRPVSPIHTVLTIPLETPVPGRGLFLPVVFEVNALAACSDEPMSPTCVLVGNQTDPALESCVSAPTRPGTVVGD